MYKIGFLVVATNKYISFVDQLENSARQYFLPDHDIRVFVFTNMTTAETVIRIPIEHEPWPYPTLKKYHYVLEHRKHFEAMDYVFLCDADMRFVNVVQTEVLGDLIATQHPGFYNQPRIRFTYECRRESTAYVDRSEGRHYFAGGFVGGRLGCFLGAADRIVRMIDDDLTRGIIAIWHDESYLNRYLIDHPPVKILSPSYCYPDCLDWAPPFPRKLLALSKDHTTLRGLAPEKDQKSPGEQDAQRRRSVFTSLRRLVASSKKWLR